MEKSQVEPFLKNERKKTDDSLVAERDKTNDSLMDTQDETEKQTDSVVQNERKAVDQIRSESRVKADSDRDQERENSDGTLNAEQRNSDSNLKNERKRADIAIQLERSRVDGAIDRERDLKSEAAALLLSQEREETDKSLFNERTQTDSRVGNATLRLSDEIAEHSKTKVSLTTRDEFLAIVSHDLRNPMGAISSCAEMLLEEPTASRMDTETKRWIEFIKRNVDTSLRMISDILDMERIAENKLELQPQKHRIGDIIKEAVESFVYVASAKTILMRVAPSSFPGDVMCDRDRILQVLSNLISNALKFTLDGGSIIVKAELLENKIVVSVQDTGPGIADEKKKQIFERFAQLASKDRRGLGLGLYISRMLVEAHSGRIWVESQVGKGSRFLFSLPLSKGQAGPITH